MDSLHQFTREFSTVDACLRHLETVRWADGPYCPHCGGSERIYHYSDGRRHKCGECRRVFRIITGTIFADSPIKMLPKWFAAIWLETCHAEGISSVQLAEHIGVTQKTAWHMLRRIRHATDSDDGGLPGGSAEVAAAGIDSKEMERHTGRRAHRTRGRSTKIRLTAFEISERHGKPHACHRQSKTRPFGGSIDRAVRLISLWLFAKLSHKNLAP